MIKELILKIIAKKSALVYGIFANLKVCLKITIYL